MRSSQSQAARAGAAPPTKPFLAAVNVNVHQPKKPFLAGLDLEMSSRVHCRWLVHDPLLRRGAHVRT